MTPLEITLIVVIVAEIALICYLVRRWKKEVSDILFGAYWTELRNMKLEHVKDGLERKRRKVDNENELLKSHLSKKPQRCAKCGQLHMAERQILEGRMPGETKCPKCLTKNKSE